MSFVVTCDHLWSFLSLIIRAYSCSYGQSISFLFSFGYLWSFGHSTCGYLCLFVVACDRWSFVVIHIHVVNQCHLWKLVIICARFYQSSSVRVSAPCSYGQSISFVFTYGFLWSFVVMYDTLWSVVVQGHSRSYPQHLCSLLSVCVHS